MDCLPEDVVFRILSLLPARDACSASCKQRCTGSLSQKKNERGRAVTDCGSKREGIKRDSFRPECCRLSLRVLNFQEEGQSRLCHLICSWTRSLRLSFYCLSPSFYPLASFIPFWRQGCVYDSVLCVYHSIVERRRRLRFCSLRPSFYCRGWAVSVYSSHEARLCYQIYSWPYCMKCSWVASLSSLLSAKMCLIIGIVTVESCCRGVQNMAGQAGWRQ